MYPSRTRGALPGLENRQREPDNPAGACGPARLATLAPRPRPRPGGCCERSGCRWRGAICSAGDGWSQCRCAPHRVASGVRARAVTAPITNHPELDRSGVSGVEISPTPTTATGNGTLHVVPGLDLAELVTLRVRDELAGMNGRLGQLVAEALDRELGRLVGELVEANVAARARNVRTALPRPRLRVRATGAAR